MTTVIRDLGLDEAGVVAEFFHTQWRENHVFYRNRELLLWQYYSNPYAKQFTDGLTFKAAFGGSELIGIFGYIPFVLNRYGAREYGCHLSAWWVHPNHRRGPTAMRLLHALQYEMPFRANIAGINTPIAEQLYERMGWVVVRNIPRVIRPLDKVRFLSMMAGSPPSLTNLASERLLSASEAEYAATTPGTCVTEVSSLEQLEEVNWDCYYWQRAACSHMGPARELAYLLWRYRDIPLFRYRCLVASRHGEIAGLLVFRVERVKDREERVVRLVDLVADEAIVPPLVSKVVTLAREDNAVMIDFFCTSEVVLSALRNCGFVDACDPTGAHYWFPHLFQPLDVTRMRLNTSWWVRDMDMSTDLARHGFLIMKGDYEFDRPN
jgi:hypothetical protein